jgi:hypothetical protein
MRRRPSAEVLGHYSVIVCEAAWVDPATLKGTELLLQPLLLHPLISTNLHAEAHLNC